MNEKDITIKNWECYKTSMQLYQRKCRKLTSFSLQYIRLFALLCDDNKNFDPIYYLNEKLK